MDNKIYMIMTGVALNRKVIICSNDICYLLFRERDNMVSDWAEVFYAEDGKRLIKAFKELSPSAFAKLLSSMMKDNENEGGGTTTALTVDEVMGLLKEREHGLEGFAEQIHEALKSNKRAIVELK